jgi:Zn-dependent protease with chaperone function
MRARSAFFNALLLAVDLVVSGTVAAGLAFMISPRLPWLVVFGLLGGAYLAFTIYALLRGTSILLKELKALPLNLALHPAVAKVLAQGYGADPARAPSILRASSRSINALSLGWENGGCLVLTDGALDGLSEKELRTLIGRESARLRGGSAAIWLGYARLSIVPTLFGRMAGRRGIASVHPALSRAFFLGNLLLFALFWLGMLVAADSPATYRTLLILGMPSFIVVTILLTNLLASVPLLGLLRLVDWRTRELAADRQAAEMPGGREAMASIFTRAEVMMPEPGTTSFDGSAWVGPIKLRKAYFINPEAWFQMRGWNPQPTLEERRKELAL